MNQSPLFIVGCERSGNTLLRYMHNAHPDFAIAEETYFIQELWGMHRSTGPYPDGLLEKAIGVIEKSEFRNWGLDKERVREKLRSLPRPDHTSVIETVMQSYADLYRKKRWGDKTPSYVQSVDIIHAIFPEAKIIHIIRDGRAVCEALLRQDFGPNSVHDAARLWMKRVNAGRRAGGRLPAGAYKEIFFKDLVREPEKTLKDICRFTGAAYTPAMLNYREVADRSLSPEEKSGVHRNLTKPINPELAVQWKSKLRLEDVLIIQGIAWRTLIACGYPLVRHPLQICYMIVGLWRLSIRNAKRSPFKLTRSFQRITAKMFCLKKAG